MDSKQAFGKFARVLRVMGRGGTVSPGAFKPEAMRRRATTAEEGGRAAAGARSAHTPAQRRDKAQDTNAQTRPMSLDLVDNRDAGANFLTELWLSSHLFNG